MNISRTDYFLIRAAHFLSPMWPFWSDLESKYLKHVKGRLKDSSIERPVFIAGLARSGTTILLETLGSLTGMATHRYRDFPFLWTPYIWNRFVDLFSVPASSSERPHNDGIMIDRESPEAFEEPLWRSCFECQDEVTPLLSDETQHPEFEHFYADHIRKVMLVRGSNRYLSKANYHVGRILYLAKLFPSAYFLIPVREPVMHVHSLVRQHRLFLDYAKQDRHVPFYLSRAGHFEFGPQRRPICFSKETHAKILDLWLKGDEHAGYAESWMEVYAHVLQLLELPELSKRIRIVQFETLCKRPQDELRSILSFIDATQSESAVQTAGARIKPPSTAFEFPEAKVCASVQSRTAAVWAKFQKIN